jgi:hypothetical protein
MIALFFITITANFIYISDPVYGDLAFRSIVLTVFALAGLASKSYLDLAESSESAILHTKSIFMKLDSKSGNIVLVWMIIGLLGIIVLNIFFGTKTSGSFLFAVAIFATIGAIGEELFFLNIQSILWSILNLAESLYETKVVKEVICIGLITLFFTYFHTVVYAGQVAALAYVAGLRFIASLQFQITRRPSISILTHLINNLLSLSGILSAFGGIIFA